MAYIEPEATTPVGDIERRLSAVEDRLAIEHLAATYCQWYDEHRWTEIIEELFTEDCVFDILSRVEGRHAIGEFFENLTRESLASSWHYEVNRRISLSGHEATVESMFFCPCVRNGDPWIAAGRYYDQVRKDKGRWQYYLKRGRFDFFVPMDEAWSGSVFGFEAARSAQRVRPYPSSDMHHDRIGKTSLDI